MAVTLAAVILAASQPRPAVYTVSAQTRMTMLPAPALTSGLATADLPVAQAVR